MTEPRGISWRGVVLAGGRSSRMGTDKAALVLNGKTLLVRAIDSLSEVVGRENVLISGSKVGFLPDLIPGLGPLGGIWASAASLDSSDWLIVVPVDMPCLAREALEKLIRVAEAGARSGIRAVHFASYELPLAFRCDEAAKSVLTRLCSSEKAAGERSIHAFLRHLNAVIVDPEDDWREFFRNVNFPSDWKELRSHECSL